MKRCVRSTIPTRFFPIHVIEIPPLKLRDSADGLSRVRDQAYCILHGPRQTGKPSDCWLWRTCSIGVREARTNRGLGWSARACGAVWTLWTEGIGADREGDGHQLRPGRACSGPSRREGVPEGQSLAEKEERRWYADREHRRLDARSRRRPRLAAGGLWTWRYGALRMRSGGSGAAKGSGQQALARGRARPRS